MNRKKLIFSITIVGCILILAIFSLNLFLNGITKKESIDDIICGVSYSHNMARITLCEVDREFTLLVEKHNSNGNSNFERINNFISKSKTRLSKKKNSSLVYLINEPDDTLTICFQNDADGDLVNGKIVQ